MYLKRMRLDEECGSRRVMSCYLIQSHTSRSQSTRTRALYVCSATCNGATRSSFDTLQPPSSSFGYFLFSARRWICLILQFTQTFIHVLLYDGRNYNRCLGAALIQNPARINLTSLRTNLFWIKYIWEPKCRICEDSVASVYGMCMGYN